MTVHFDLVGTNLCGTGIYGPGTFNPASLFGNHQVVKIGTQYYDPTYGVVYNSLTDIDNLAIDGYYKRLAVLLNEDEVGIDLNSDGDMIDQQVPTDVYMLQKNPVGNQLVEQRREFPSLLICTNP